MRHIKMFHAALAALVTVLAGGYAQAEDAAVEDTPAADETPAVTKVKRLKPKYTSVMTVSGYTGESELENFPVAVRISTANILGFDYAKCDGEGDVTFTDNDGNILPHEIEVWNTEGESVAWVSIPKLSTVVAEDKTTYTTFKMHWGHETKLADTKSTEVWTASAYPTVWHMAQSDVVKDSSTSSRNMTVSTSWSHGVETNNNSKIGVSFTARASAANSAPAGVMSTGNIYLGYTGPDKSGAYRDCTLSGWMNIKGFTGTNGNPLGPYKKGSTYYWSLYPYSSWSKLCLRFKSTSAEATVANLAPKSAGWFHYAIKIDKSRNFSLYINGKNEGTSYKAAEGQIYYKGPLTLYLAGLPGYLDETRIRDALSSDDWIKAEYDSINNKQFVVASEAVKNGYGLKIIVR